MVSIDHARGRSVMVVRLESDELDFSVIYRLTDAHGAISETLGCLESWVSGQTHDRSRYEVIVVSDGTRPDLDEQARRRLAPLDSLIVRPTRQPFELYTLGARAARGQFLFLTESHTKGHADCLRAMRACLDERGYDLAVCRILGAGYEGHWLTRLYRRKEDEFLRSREAPEDWRKVNINGSAIRRTTYESLGGFEHEFDRFAQFALSAKFAEAARPMGLAAESIAYHVDSPELDDMVGPMHDYVLGDMACRARYPARYCERYFGYSPEWELRGEYRRDLARDLVDAMLRRLPASFARPRTLWSMVRRLGEVAPTALFGSSWLVKRPWWAAWLALAWAGVWRHHVERSYAAYERSRRHFDAHFRAAALEAYFSALPAPPAIDGRLSLADVEADRLAGFYPVEQRPEGAFRWSQPAAAIDVGLPPGDYRVRLSMLALRAPDQPVDAAVYFDGHRLRRVSAAGEREAAYALTRSMFRAGGERHTIVLLCTRFRPAHADSRVLGLPLTSLAFEAAP
jgi:hypothetical protein